MRHCHWQTETREWETLSGFDPSKEEDRKFVHEIVDEFLDYLAKKMNNTTGNIDCETKHIPGAIDPILDEGPMREHFTIFGHIDEH